MSTTISLPVAPGMANMPMQRRIEVVPANQQHTLVVQSGAARRCLRFNVAVSGDKLRKYCSEQFGWKGLETMQMTADDQLFAPNAISDVTLEPTTAKVAFDAPVRAKTVEFRRLAPAKG